jgi:hypothetical protein
VEAKDVLEIINAGGVAGMALIVWLEMREYRKQAREDLNTHREDLKVHRDNEMSLLEGLDRLLEWVVERFKKEDETKEREKEALELVGRVQGVIQKEISDAHDHDRVPFAETDDVTPAESPRAKREREGKPRSKSNPYLPINKPDKDR